MKKRVLSVLLSIALLFTSADFTVFATGQTTEAEIMSEEETNSSSKEKQEEELEILETNTRTEEVETFASQEDEVSTNSIERTIEEETGKPVESEENSESTETVVENSDIQETFSTEKYDDNITESENETTETELAEKQKEKDLLSSEMISGKCGDNLTWTLTDDGTLTISGIGNMYNYNDHAGGGSPWHNNYNNIKIVVIEENVTSIGDYAFSWCTSLANITIPESVTSIGCSVFSNCSSLESITIPQNITNISDYVVYNCRKLKSIIIPKNVTSIGAGAFCDCRDLTSIIIPENVTSIGANAFKNCSSLTSITVPQNVTIINTNVFNGCSGLTNITIPENVTAIGYQAFRDCSGLTGIITIPKSVTSIGAGAFWGCRGLTGIAIPESVISIGDSSFRDCSGLKTAGPIGGGYDYEFGWTKVIPRDAFSYCNSLTSIIIPESVTSIGDQAFNGCQSLISMTIPESVTSIGDRAFQSCSSLSSITIPESVVSMGGRTLITSLDISMFSGCSSLKTAGPIGGGYDYEFGWTSSIPDDAFSGCSGLTRIIVPESVTSIGDCAFNGCSNLTNIIIPKGVTNIGSRAFWNCSDLTSAGPIGGGYDYEFGWTGSIPDSAFSGCSGLARITVPESVTSIGGYAFQNCSGLTSVIVPESVTSIGEYAFWNCSGLTSAGPIGGGYDYEFGWTNSIPDNAFFVCNDLTSIVIPKGVTNIGNYAFFACSSLTNVAIPKSVANIGASAFSGCSGLTSIIIPESVTNIDKYAFSNCSGLTSIIIPENVTNIDEYAFSNCSGLTSIIIPESVTNIDEYAFSNCSGLTSVIFKGNAPNTLHTWSNIFKNVVAKLYYPSWKTGWKSIVSNNNDGNWVWFPYNEDTRPWEMDSNEAVPQIWASFNMNPSDISYNTETGYSTKKFNLNVNAIYMHIDTESSSNYENVKMTLELPQGLSLSNSEEKRTFTNVFGTMDSTDNKCDSSYPIYIMTDTYTDKFQITVTITADNCELPQVYTFSIPITKNNKVLAFDASEYRVYTGERVMIAARVINYDNFNENEVKWISSDGNMVSVTPSSCGSLGDTTYFWATVYNSGKSLGKAKITVTIPDGRSASCIVNALGNKPTQVTPSYQVHKRHETNELLQYYGDNWEEKYNEYVEAVKKSLKKYASSDEGIRAEAISNLAGKMKQNDNKSNSKYLSFSADFPNSWKNNAYTALATYLCDNTCSKMDFDNKVSEKNLVNTVLKSIVSTSEEYKFGNVVMSVSAFQFSGTKTGSMTCYNSTKPSRKYTAVICSTKSECEAAIRDYYNQLYDLEETALYNIYTAVGQDILGKPLSTFTEKWLKSHLSKYINRLNASGIGDLYDSLRKCYEYYQFVNNISNGNVDAAGKMLDSVSKIKIDDTTITDRVVKKAARKLDKAGQELNKAYIDYINGELKENGLQRFWRVTFGCPVSVSVWNSDREQIGYVGSDDIWYIDSISIEESGNAVIIDSYIDEKLSFTITGTDYGIMGCSIEEYDLGNIPLCRANFYDIALEPDIELSLNLTKSLAEDLESISMESSDGQYFSVDEYIPVDQDGAVTVNCVVEADESIGNDSVSGSGTYVKGDVVVLTAFPQTGHRFIGWFNGEELITTSRVYEFIAKESIDLKALFKQEELSKLSMPNSNYETGLVKKGTQVILTSDEDVPIYYTTDSTDPTADSNLYSEAITINEDTVLKAIAVKEGYLNSDIVTFVYTIAQGQYYTITFNSNGGTEIAVQTVQENGKVTEPSVPVREGYIFTGWYLNGVLYDFDAEVTVDIVLEAGWAEDGKVATPTPSIASGSIVEPGTRLKLISSENAKIYYTLDETAPTVSSTLFTEDILITQHIVIKAFAVQEGLKDSDVATFVYDISTSDNPNDRGDVLPEDIPESGIPNGLWIAGIKDVEYTGKAIKPPVRVYDYKTRLIEKQDYTISYKNNIKANNAANESKAPSIIIKAKGNYSGKETATFKILPKDISSADFDIVDITANPNKKVQKPVPVITDKGKRLANKKDFTVVYPDKSAGAYKEKGTYTIQVSGKGNYTGEKTINLIITDNQLITKAKISKITNQQYTGKALTPTVQVKYGKTMLSEGTDYELVYQNNTEIGTANVVVKGKGDYSGQKTVSFKIIGVPINKGKVVGINSPSVFSGKEITRNFSLVVTVAGNQKTLKEGQDYTVKYQNNKNVGKATVILTGTNEYSGTLKKTFKINAYDLQTDTNKKISYSKNITVPYAKNGSCPEPDIYFDGIKLEKGKDYNLSYRNNKAVNNGTKSSTVPEIIVKGKGNFKGTLPVSFVITSQNLSNLTLAASDKAYKNRANIFATSIKITDINGKTLSAVKDYDKNSVVYSYVDDVNLENGVNKKAGDNVEKTDIIPADTKIQIAVTAKAGGNYEGTAKSIYRIIKSDIKNAKISIPAQTYTGKAIVPTKADITITVGGTKLSESEFEIVSCTNNIKKGKASVTIKGVGNYGGTKTIKFTIKSRGFLWWWRK